MSSPRDLPTAIMTAATIVIVALVCFVEGRTTTALLAAVIIGVASIEFNNALRTKGFRCGHAGRAGRERDPCRSR